MRRNVYILADIKLRGKQIVDQITNESYKYTVGGNITAENSNDYEDIRFSNTSENHYACFVFERNSRYGGVSTCMQALGTSCN